ncbi:MAG TPA: hypothetical protein VMU29_13010 [Smithella sp.]|nr:hypothetical protein [Smithella sp.]
MLHFHFMRHFNPANIISDRFPAEPDTGAANEWMMEHAYIQCRLTALPLDDIPKTKILICGG